jgi:hypothetical protein
MIDPYLALLVTNPPTIAERAGVPSLIKYIYVLVVTKPRPIFPVYLVTLEKGFTPETFLCVFDRRGVHGNLGADPLLSEENRFIERAINLVRKEFGISGQARELPGMPGSEAE